MANKQFDIKIENFQSALKEMGETVENAIKRAIEAVKSSDEKEAVNVAEDDYLINAMRDTIETEAVRILISQTPYGRYIRIVIAGLKMATHFERMGDYAAHLTSIAKNKTNTDIKNKIVQMASSALSMATSANKALFLDSAEYARQVAVMDDDIDKKKKEIDELTLKKSPATEEEKKELYDYFFVVKEIERLGDRITSLCAWVVYLHCGDKPKLN